MIPIEIIFEGKSDQASLLKNGAYGHTLKLEAANSFSVVKTVRHLLHLIVPYDANALLAQITFSEGELAGYQAVILRPAKPFPFLKLSKEIRKRIYDLYFAPKGVLNSDITVEAKRASNKELYAKQYAEGSKDRVALLAINKEVYEEAIPVLYDHTFKLESSVTLLDFMGQLPNSARGRFNKISIKTYVKTQGRTAMHFLADWANITHLYIDSGVVLEGDPAKAAKTFYIDAYKFLEAMGARKGDKAAGLDVLSFGKQAFTYKDDKKTSRPYSNDMLADFRKHLKAKLK